ncbi:MAG: dicarboxylate/amino acid:cation symporter [Prevotella sp.]|nr:dicarboxylate/amino acid:cation symporter [Bacteroides sp.]MCM1366791.1 dicarboxylate/amino acid:cation symporter [Prevotella sp.]MCM1436458.1 dicarboxylate/amino acid:cation symporter [Prevotella sp.]
MTQNTNLKKRFKLPLLAQIIIAIGLGIGAGYIFPLWLGRIFATFNAIFSQFLGFLIPLIIVGFITPAIADIGKKAGTILLVTAALAYIDTILAGFASFFTGDLLFPSLISPSSLSEIPQGHELTPFFTIEMPPLMTVMTGLVLAFMSGIAMAVLHSKSLKNIADEFKDIIALTIAKVIIPLLPIYIFGIFLNMTVSGQVAPVLSAFIKIIAIIFALTFLLLIVQFCIAACFNRKNPFKMLLTMLPAYFTALGTQSSAATIPVTLRQTIKLGVNEEIAGFTIPLCATIHMSGSTLKIVACSIALMLMQGIPYDFPLFAGFICMLAITIVAAPGVPGGAIMASLGLLSGILGFSEADQALMIALYIAMDSFGTACNVTGDGYIAVIVDKLFPAKKQ